MLTRQLGVLLLQQRRAAPVVLNALSVRGGRAPPGLPPAPPAAAAHPAVTRRAFTTTYSPALAAVYGGAARFGPGAGVPTAGIAPMRLPRNLGITIVPERCAYVVERWEGVGIQDACTRDCGCAAPAVRCPAEGTEARAGLPHPPPTAALVASTRCWALGCTSSSPGWTALRTSTR
jgi:hypothetical protein